jgi:hypothetical protein
MVAFLLGQIDKVIVSLMRQAPLLLILGIDVNVMSCIG